MLNEDCQLFLLPDGRMMIVWTRNFLLREAFTGILGNVFPFLRLVQYLGKKAIAFVNHGQGQLTAAGAWIWQIIKILEEVTYIVGCDGVEFAVPKHVHQVNVDNPLIYNLRAGASRIK